MPRRNLPKRHLFVRHSVCHLFRFSSTTSIELLAASTSPPSDGCGGTVNRVRYPPPRVPTFKWHFKLRQTESCLDRTGVLEFGKFA